MGHNALFIVFFSFELFHYSHSSNKLSSVFHHPICQHHFPVSPGRSWDALRPADMCNPSSEFWVYPGVSKPAGYAQKTSKGRCPRGFLIRCLNHLSWYSSKLYVDVWASNPLSNAVSSHPTEKIHFSCLYPRCYLWLTTAGDGHSMVPLINRKCYFLLFKKKKKSWDTWTSLTSVETITLM